MRSWKVMRAGTGNKKFILYGLIGRNVLPQMSTLRMLAYAKLVERLLNLLPGFPSPVNQNNQTKIIKRYKETR